MPISIRIHPDAFNAGGPLAGFQTRPNPPFAFPLQPPQVPSFNNPPGSTFAPGPGFIASASPLTHRTNIAEDGSTGAAAPSPTSEEKNQIIVHIAPTSGSTVIRGDTFVPGRIEFNPAYGLNVGIAPIELQEDLFEQALSETVGNGFITHLQDLITRGIIEVRDESGSVMDAGDLASYTAP